MAEDLKEEKEIIEEVETAQEETVEEQAAEESAETCEETVETTEEKAEEPKEKTPEELAAELQDKLLRKQAEFDNYRKRMARELQDARAFSKTATLEEFLPVYDNFKMAMMAIDNPNTSLEMMAQGMKMIQGGFTKAFEDLGVTEVDALGQEFDVHQHEAVGHEYSEDVPEGTVITQHRCGYKAGDRLLRAAVVIVSKGPQPEEGTEEA